MPDNAPQDWFAPGLRFTCTQCGNCCTGAPGYVWFDEAEAAAMAKLVGLTPSQFRQAYARRLGGRWSLREVERDGKLDCVFLKRSADGRALCSVYSARPQQCRTWPFWPENLANRAAWRRAAGNCPGMNQGRFVPADQVRLIRDSNEPQ